MLGVRGCILAVVSLGPRVGAKTSAFRQGSSWAFARKLAIQTCALRYVVIARRAGLVEC